MATPKKIKVFKATLKHGNTYSAGPYHFQLGRTVDIRERDEAIARHLMKHPSFDVREAYVQVAAEAVPEAAQIAQAIKESQSDVVEDPEVPDEDEGGDEQAPEEEGAETAAAHAEATQPAPTPTPKPQAQVRRVPKRT